MLKHYCRSTTPPHGNNGRIPPPSRIICPARPNIQFRSWNMTKSPVHWPGLQTPEVLIWISILDETEQWLHPPPHNTQRIHHQCPGAKYHRTPSVVPCLCPERSELLSDMKTIQYKPVVLSFWLISVHNWFWTKIVIRTGCKCILKICIGFLSVFSVREQIIIIIVRVQHYLLWYSNPTEFINWLSSINLLPVLYSGLS